MRYYQDPYESISNHDERIFLNGDNVNAMNSLTTLISVKRDHPENWVVGIFCSLCLTYAHLHQLIKKNILRYIKSMSN